MTWTGPISPASSPRSGFSYWRSASPAASISTPPMLGEVLGLSTRLSLRLSGIGVAILIAVAVVGSYLKEDEEG